MIWVYKVTLERAEGAGEVAVSISKIDEDQLEFVDEMLNFTASDLEAATNSIGRALARNVEAA